MNPLRPDPARDGGPPGGQPPGRPGGPTVGPIPDGDGEPGTRRDGGAGRDLDRGVYGISVAAELVGMGVQTLRLYEARGLLEPDRTAGGTRRYSENDLERLRRIGSLLGAGLNIAGIAMVLDLEQENAELRADRDPDAVLDRRP
jgi:MerR family transcriptional regulator, heat shock protein HspR